MSVLNIAFCVNKKFSEAAYCELLYFIGQIIIT